MGWGGVGDAKGKWAEAAIIDPPPRLFISEETIFYVMILKYVGVGSDGVGWGGRREGERGGGRYRPTDTSCHQRRGDIFL